MEYLTHIDVVNIAYRLKLKRISLRLTQLEVEHLFGINHAALCRLETGLHSFNYQTVAALTAFSGLRPEDIFITYTTRPTRHDWQRLKRLDKQLQRCKKSKVYRQFKMCRQLELEFAEG